MSQKQNASFSFSRARVRRLHLHELDREMRQVLRSNSGGLKLDERSRQRKSLAKYLSAQLHDNAAAFLLWRHFPFSLHPPPLLLLSTLLGQPKIPLQNSFELRKQEEEN